MNQSQRIILIAEQFDYEVLVAAEWLHERYGVDISCIRLDLAVDDKGAPTRSEYLALTQVYPMKELEEIAVNRGRREPTAPTPEFLAVIAVYNGSAPPDIRAEGRAASWRMIHPADWPSRKFLAYSFYQPERFYILLEVYPDAPQGLAELLAPLHGKLVADGQAPLVWDAKPNYYRKGRLFARFPSTTPAETVAQAMRDLIAMTRTMISNKLRTDRPENGSTGN